jgi:hypothetical protein
MKRSTLYVLASIFFTSLLLRLLPLTNSLYWGADYGEYYHISSGLIADGRIADGYLGWGIVYPDFPGMQILASTFTLLSELSVASSLSIAVPFIASLSVIFIFLIAVEIFKDERIGLVAAGFVAVVMPHVYPTSHAMPGSIGDLLLIVCLLLFVKMQSDPKMMAALVPISFALILTHHLSTYFLLICMMAAVFIRIIFASKPRLRDLKSSFAFIITMATATMLYWILSPNFRDSILNNAFPWWAVPLLTGLAISFLAVFAVLKGRTSYRPKVRFPSFKSSIVFFSLILSAVIIIFLFQVIFGIPGTTMKVDSSSFVFFLPLIIFISFSGFAIGHFGLYRKGPNITGWLVAVVVSLFVGALFAPRFLIPYRHTEYLMIPLSFFVGMGLVLFHDFWTSKNQMGQDDAKTVGGPSRRRAGKTVAVALLVVLLIGANAITAYPPRDIMLGYSEGTTAKGMDGVIWVKHMTGEHSTIASDHRLSSIIFGFGNRNSTWGNAPLTLRSDSFGDAVDEMTLVELPSGVKRIDYVLIDEDVKDGALISVWEIAEPLSQEAVDKFESSNYTKLYDDGYSQLFMVNW